MWFIRRLREGGVDFDLWPFYTGIPGALRPASSPWCAARSSPAEVTGLSNGGAGHKSAFGVPIHNLFLVLLWSPWERASHRRGGSPLHGGARRSRAACGSGHPVASGCGPRSLQAARLLVLRAFRATAPAELQALLRDEGVAAPDDPVMQELAPLVAAVQTLPPVTRQQLVQLWQATLQLVQGGNGPRQPAVQACDAGVACPPSPLRFPR